MTGGGVWGGGEEGVLAGTSLATFWNKVFDLQLKNGRASVDQ